ITNPVTNLKKTAVVFLFLFVLIALPACDPITSTPIKTGIFHIQLNGKSIKELRMNMESPIPGPPAINADSPHGVRLVSQLLRWLKDSRGITMTSKPQLQIKGYGIAQLEIILNSGQIISLSPVTKSVTTKINNGEYLTSVTIQRNQVFYRYGSHKQLLISKNLYTWLRAGWRRDFSI
ncbi:hypothetical protein, partial [Ferroacidibacillus organovorans]|uniref:hypothetical protein n=1 Tax=Ferroacidibacillus organovorans TaxID=1765683 RepID=UPI001E455DCF